MDFKRGGSGSEREECGSVRPTILRGPVRGAVFSQDRKVIFDASGRSAFPGGCGRLMLPGAANRGPMIIARIGNSVPHRLLQPLSHIHVVRLSRKAELIPCQLTPQVTANIPHAFVRVPHHRLS